MGWPSVDLNRLLLALRGTEKIKGIDLSIGDLFPLENHRAVQCVRVDIVVTAGVILHTQLGVKRHELNKLVSRCYSVKLFKGSIEWTSSNSNKSEKNIW